MAMVREELSYQELVNSDNLYSERQQIVLFVLPIFSGSLSMLGSLTVVYILMSDWRRKLKHVYHRLLLVYSCIDIVVSFNYALSSLVVPQSTPNTFGAMGNRQTCAASGFFLQFSMSLGLYSAFICTYYLLIIRYNVREETIATKIEPFIHLCGLTCPLIMGLAMLALGMYNPGNVHTGHCFINVYPANCLRVEGVPCQRGESYQMWGLITITPFFFYFLTVTHASITTYWTVRTIEQKQRRWSFLSNSSFLQSSPTLSPSPLPPSTKARQSLIQALLYVVAFFVTYSAYGVTGFVNMKYDAVEENRNLFFPLVAIVKLCLPAQGVWNFFIFIRPRYHSVSRRNRNAHTIALLRQIIFSAKPKQEQRDCPESHVVDLSNKTESVRVHSDDNLSTDFTPELHLATETPTGGEKRDHGGEPSIITGGATA